MLETEKGVLGENTSKRNWFVYASKKEGNKRRIIKAASLCLDDFPTKDDFWREFNAKKVELAHNYGAGCIGTGSGGGFLEYLEAWDDELVFGVED